MHLIRNDSIVSTDDKKAFTDLQSVSASRRKLTLLVINHHAVLAAIEGGLNQTGLVCLTSLMNIRGLHNNDNTAEVVQTSSRCTPGSSSHRPTRVQRAVWTL